MKSQTPETLRLQSFAKINLGLRILDRRPDGYHNIESVMTPVLPCDEIMLTTSPEISMTCDDSGLACDDGNLCMRAAHILRQESGITDGVRIHLQKRIPVGAGLGGGSSDAAAVLRGLCQLWNLKIQQQSLTPLAAQIGSDVPFFLRANSAAVSGRGEAVEYFDLDIPYWIVIVYPGIHCSTAWAYSEIDKLRKGPHGKESSISNPFKERLVRDLNFPDRLKSWLKNDFEEIIIRAYPLVEKIRHELYRQGAVFTQLSGSGSSLYAFFDDEEQAMNVCSSVEGEFGVFLTPPHFSGSLR